MNEQSIKKLKRRFTAVAMLSFVLVMILMGTFIFLFNLCFSRAEIRRVLHYIAENDGVIPETDPYSPAEDGQEFHNPAFRYDPDGNFAPGDIRGALDNLFQIGRGYDSPEYFYTIRYFAVLYDENQAVDEVIVNHIASVDGDKAVKLADNAKKRFFRFGSFGNYYYLNTKRPEGGRIVIYMDSRNQIYANNRILLIAMIFLFMGSIITFLVIRALSGHVIKPEIRNAERQKQFMTNASHELKTPLSVIRANTELLEMSNGENEWTQATMRQIDRLEGLIENLVMITRAQEQDAKKEQSVVDVSKSVRETAEAFRSMASQDKKELLIETPDGIRLRAAESDVRQLTSLLVDNAIKYCDEGGTIRVVLARTGRIGKGMRLTVENSFADGKDVDCDRFFDRFYRADESHNTEKGGYGIGLSIAEQIVKNYHGSIKASWADGTIRFECQLS
ncbi:MAG: GHKL domain-containing protein [Lachnospiraceae bacterium]|nr:GHKL domain-containing protein [Lachnospiraceae bacterium]